ncbi:hypothetical protein ZHAS_00009493 [Anopheles sinensis]|uniref:Uncharacterized protein n=1 Tax=Anopheles sinensis TaxID=74873 RepID=A0A084VVD6_ANOSI|nr:hypothetical protein ZHAS_00009493 [Anopheles sinensis]
MEGYAGSRRRRGVGNLHRTATQCEPATRRGIYLDGYLVLQVRISFPYFAALCLRRVGVVVTRATSSSSSSIIITFAL